METAGFGVSGLRYGEVKAVSVGTTSTEILSSSETEKLEFICLTNTSDSDISIALGAVAVVNSGIVLPSKGGYAFEGSAMPRGIAINAITATGSKNIAVQVAA